MEINTEEYLSYEMAEFEAWMDIQAEEEDFYLPVQDSIIEFLN